MNFLESAIKLARQGFHVFPLQPNGKLPVIDDFPNLATRDEDQIRKWWTDPIMGFQQPFNVGISTTKFGNGEALVVIDVDNKGKKKGTNQLAALKKSGHTIPPTLVQETPTGGMHLIYRTVTATKQGANVLAEGLDIRSRGGYIVGAGSTIESRAYLCITEHPIAPCPEWVIDRCGIDTPKKTFDTPIEINQDTATSRAIDYLRNHAPLSIEGAGGDETAFKVAAAVKDLGVDDITALDLMLTHWNDRCEPPWDANTLAEKISNAYAYGQNSVGSKAPEAHFKPVEEITESNYLEKINENYALVFSNGEHSILFETVDNKGRVKREFFNEATFKRKFSPKLVQQGKSRAKSFAELWLDWEGRREYSGVCFTPEQEPKYGYFNLWRGFAVKAKAYEDSTPAAKLGFDMYIEHARTNVCGGDERLFNWMMGYFAHLIQKPYERPLVTLVYRGRKGVGKNVLIERIGKLLGHGHSLVVNHPRYLVSNFNGHMDSCLVLVLDEALWSGDKSADSVLKSITTAPEIMIERKGKDPYMVDNLQRLVIIGNEQWLVPASSDERRYAVFDVGEGRKQQTHWFEKMVHLMDVGGGNEILIDYLKKFDLKSMDVNVAPITQGLHDQKMQSLSPIEQFWHQCLLEGKLSHSDFVQDWNTKVDKEVFRSAFKRYCKESNIRSWVMTEVAMTKELKRMTKSIDADRKITVEGNRVRCYTFSDLETCRKEWDELMGFEGDWS